MTIVIGVLVLALAAGAVVVAGRSSSSGGRDLAAGAASSAMSVGLLAPTPEQVDALRASDIRRVMLPSGWGTLQPRPGVLDPTAVATLRARVDGARRAGLTVVLDPGLQYPPAWVFDLPGQTRFVDQYGDVWHGGVSEDVANAVFDPAVRTAEATYLHALGAALGGNTVGDVRVGGLLSGELRFPPSDYAGHRRAVWAYDAQARAASPVPGWRPGSKDSDRTRTWLQWYMDQLTGYLSWLMDATGAAFPDAGQQVLFPSWGVRPGMLDKVVATGLTQGTPTDAADAVCAGLDWAAQVKVVASGRHRAIAYSTWLDAPSYDDSAWHEAPIAYLSGLAAKLGLGLGGENTGGSGRPALHTALSQAMRYRLRTVMYMSGELIADGRAGLRLSDLTSEAAALPAS